MRRVCPTNEMPDEFVPWQKVLLEWIKLLRWALPAKRPVPEGYNYIWMCRRLSARRSWEFAWGAAREGRIAKHASRRSEHWVFWRTLKVINCTRGYHQRPQLEYNWCKRFMANLQKSKETRVYVSTQRARRKSRGGASTKADRLCSLDLTAMWFPCEHRWGRRQSCVWQSIF